MNDLCRGCRYTKDDDVHPIKLCLIVRIEMEEECPCINCLVKMICSRNCNVRNRKREGLRRYEPFDPFGKYNQ